MEGSSANQRLRIIAAILAMATVAAVLAVWITYWPGQGRENPSPQLPTRLARDVAEFTKSLAPDGPYRSPTMREQQIATLGIGLLLDDRQNASRARRCLATLGFSVRLSVDEATGRPYALIVNAPNSARAWGMYIVDLSAPVRLAIEVPHPNSDLRTEELGLSLFRRVPGSLLLIAGAHRDAADKAADVAHQKDSVFNAVATEFAERDLPQVQLHGFHDKNLPGRDIVLSTGTGDEDELAELTVEQLTWAQFSVCSASRERCGQLEGTRNTQGRIAAEFSSPYLHIEVSRSVRENDRRREILSKAIATALLF